jgi:molybdate transport system substrate-binding protein
MVLPSRLSIDRRGETWFRSSRPGAILEPPALSAILGLMPRIVRGCPQVAAKPAEQPMKYDHPGGRQCWVKAADFRPVPVVVGLKEFIMSVVTVKVLCIPGMTSAMEALGPEFERTTGYKPIQSFGLPSQLRESINRGDFDVALFSSDTIDDLITQEKIDASTCLAAACMSIGVAARTGAPQPDISSVASFKHALLQATSISYTKDSAAGIYLAGLMERLGIAEELQAKTKLMGGGGQNPRAVATGDVELGLSVISDILPVSGVELVGPLPSELQHSVIVVAGVHTVAKEPGAARALIQFLTSETL